MALNPERYCQIIYRHALQQNLLSLILILSDFKEGMSERCHSNVIGHN
jgi:hypothetical protein